MSRLSRRYIRIAGDLAGGQLHLRLAEPEVRRRRALLCFHLSPVSGAIYDALLPEMGRDRLVVAPDTPGYGASDAPAAPPGIADYARTFGAMLDALDLTEVDCIGYHTGSKIALELALQRPQTVRHLVLISAPVYTDDELAAQRTAYEPIDPRADGQHLLEYWRELWRYRGPGQTAEMIMRCFPDHLRGGNQRHWGHRAAFGYDHRQRLPLATQPVLVINPADDLTAFTARAAPLIRHGELLDRPQWGHGFLDLHTADFAALLRRFLDDQQRDA